MFSRLFAPALLILAAACGRPSEAATRSANAPTHVDSVVPRELALRRFQGSARPVDTLSGGARSRDELVKWFVRAVETRDSASLQRLLLDRNEFAYLYYPTNPQGLPPYDLSPDLMWFLLQNGSAKGLTRLMESRAGQPLGYRGYTCDSIPSHQGENVVWGPCVLRRHADGGDGEERVFGLILERGGRFKFVSYANRL